MEILCALWKSHRAPGWQCQRPTRADAILTVPRQQGLIRDFEWWQSSYQDPGFMDTTPKSQKQAKEKAKTPAAKAQKEKEVDET